MAWYSIQVSWSGRLCWSLAQIPASSAGFRTGSARHITASSTLKAAAEMPMVVARETAINAVAPGRRRQERTASLKSDRKLCISGP